MDDIDEGIGSNESAVNSKDALQGFDVIKGLNGQSILPDVSNKLKEDDSNTNMSDLTSSEIGDIATKINGIAESVDEDDGCNMDVDSDLENTDGTSSETANKNASTASATVNNADSNPLENTKNTTDSPTTNKGTKTEAQIINDSSSSKENNNAVVDVEKSKIGTNKQLSVKSQFLINDKVRQSLKGLTEKIKTTPDKKQDLDKALLREDEVEKATKSLLKEDDVEKATKEMSAEDENKAKGSVQFVGEVDNAKPTESSKHDDNKCTNMDEKTDVEMAAKSSRNTKYDDILAAATDDGFIMDVESENEDELLRSSEEESTKDESLNNQKSTQIVKEDNLPVHCNKGDESFETLEKQKSCDIKTKAASENDKPQKSIVLGLDPTSPIVLDLNDDLIENEQSSMDVDNVKETAKSTDVKTEQMESKSLAEEEDDDDIIFEGETKAHKEANVPKVESAPSSEPIKKPSVSEEPVKSPLLLVDDDDDVIIGETEGKAEKSDTCKPAIVDTKDVKHSVLGATDSIKAENTDSKTPVHINGLVHPPDRKRPMEETDSTPDIKRSKLDHIKGEDLKLKNGHDSIELSDSDEGNDQSLDSGINESKVSVKPEVKDTKLPKAEKKLILTEAELNTVVMDKVRLYLMTAQTSLITQMSKKIKDLQANNDLWKKQVKDLQNKVFEVTVLQQKLEKRKAATAALRQITTRTVGVQVDDGKTSTMRERLSARLKQGSPRGDNAGSPKGGARAPTPMQTTSPKTTNPTSSLPLVTAPPGANGMIRLPIPQSSIASTSISTSQSQTAFPTSQGYMAPTVKSLLDTTRVQMTIGGSTPLSSTPTNSVINLIPIHNVVTTATSSGQPQTLIALPPGSTVTTTNGGKSITVNAAGQGTKVIDLTDDEESSKTRLVTLTQAALSTMTTQMTGLPQGAQLIRSPVPNVGYQLVFSPSSPALRPAIHGVPALAPAGPPLLQQTASPTTVVNLTSPPNTMTQGASLARAAAPMAPVIHSQTAPAAPAPQPSPAKAVLTHPAPFPVPNSYKDVEQRKLLPPKPTLKISRVSQGIVLSWNMTVSKMQTDIANYQLFAYQESNAPPSPNLWKKVGDVKALPLPMACTLTQFQVGNKYHFAVRAVDVKNRIGLASDASTIHLTSVPPK